MATAPTALMMSALSMMAILLAGAILLSTTGTPYSTGAGASATLGAIMGRPSANLSKSSVAHVA